MTKTMLATLAAVAMGCGQSSAPAPEVPASQETSTAEAPAVAAAPAEAPAPAPAPVLEPVEPAVVAVPPPSGEQLSAWYAQCWRSFNERNWDQFTQCFAENAVSMEPGNPTLWEGRSDIVDKHAKGFATAFTDGTGTLQIVLVQPKEIASVVHFKGTHDGTLVTPSGEIEATKKKVGFLALHRVQLDNDYKVVKEWLVFDAPSLMTQLGKAKGGRRAVTRGLTSEPIVHVARGDETEKTNLANTARFYELFTKHDPAIYELAHGDVVDINPGQPRDFKGKAAVKKMLDGYFKAFSNLRADTESMWAAGPYTLAVGRFRGTNDGAAPALGLKQKTDKSIDMAFVEVLEWKDGKLAKLMPFYNGLEMAMQLGLVPPPGSEPAARPAPGAAAPAEKKPTAKADTAAAASRATTAATP